MSDFDVTDEMYAAGRARGLEQAWEAINRWIKTGPLPEPAASERNGMVLAANAVRDLIDRPFA